MKIASADPPAHSSFLDEWLARGYAGEMAYLQRSAAVRKNVKEKFPWAKTIICLAVTYPDDPPRKGIAKHIARYAQGDDYHEVFEEPLKEIERYICETAELEFGITPQTWRYTDTGPVMEKLYAAAAGIGWIGKNTLILNESHGSYLLLAELITNLPLPPDPPVIERCGTCTRCLDACPTHAFVSPYVLDATRCISYQTIENKKDIPAEIAKNLHGNLFGCDICQEVCPWNRPSEVHSQNSTFEDAFRSRTAYHRLGLNDLATMPPASFHQTFRKSPLKRPGLEKLKWVARLISDPSIIKMSAEEKTPIEERGSKPRLSESQNTPSA